MVETNLECVACGELLRVREGADRCQCVLCEVPHVVDRSTDPPRVRLPEPNPIPTVLRRTQENLKAVCADIRFFEDEARSCRNAILISVGAILASFALGGYIFVWAGRTEGQEPDTGTLLMPTMSLEVQHRVAQQVIGLVVAFVGVLLAVFLPWHHWRKPAKALSEARAHRAILEDLVRRLEERARARLD